MKNRRTRRGTFLDKMGGLTPWHRLEEPIEPFSPKPGRCRRAYPLGVMRRVQLFYNLSDPGMEGLLHDVGSVRRFVGRRRSVALPDETTILNFRHLWGWGDAGWQGVGKPEENRDAEVDGQVSMKAG